MKRTRLRPVSRKRAAANRTYTALRRGFLAANPRCIFPHCTDRATEVHHRRGRVGDNFLNVDTWSPMCSIHHEFVTLHPVAARAMGLSEYRNGAA